MEQLRGAWHPDSEASTLWPAATVRLVATTTKMLLV